MKAFNVQQRLEYFRGFSEVTRERNWSRAILEHSPRNGQRTVRSRADSACIVLGTRKLFLLARGPLRITQHARTTLVPLVRRRNTSERGGTRVKSFTGRADVFHDAQLSR